MTLDFVFCDACGLVLDGELKEWYSVHIGTLCACLFVEPLEIDPGHLADGRACSEECLVQLLRRWSRTCRKQWPQVAGCANGASA